MIQCTSYSVQYVFSCTYYVDDAESSSNGSLPMTSDSSVAGNNHNTTTTSTNTNAIDTSAPSKPFRITGNSPLLNRHSVRIGDNTPVTPSSSSTVMEGASNYHVDSSTTTNTSQPSHNSNLPTIQQGAAEEEAVEGIGNRPDELHQYDDPTHNHSHIQTFHHEAANQVSPVV